MITKKWILTGFTAGMKNTFKKPKSDARWKKCADAKITGGIFMKLKVKKLCSEAKLPSYAHAGDSGMDLS